MYTRTKNVMEISAHETVNVIHNSAAHTEMSKQTDGMSVSRVNYNYLLIVVMTSFSTTFHLPLKD